MSDSATDRPEFRQAINEAIGWDDRKNVAGIYQALGGRVTEGATDYEALLAIALWGAETALTYADHDGLLVTPAHDAAVAAKAWDEGYRYACSDHHGYASCITRDHGQRNVNPYLTEHGASDV